MMKRITSCLDKMISIQSKKFASLLSKGQQPISRSYADITAEESRVDLSKKVILFFD